MAEKERIIDAVQRFLQDIKNPKLTTPIRLKKVKQLFHLILHRISDDTQVLFTSSFSRLCYIQSTLRVEYKEMFLLHMFRKIDQKADISDIEKIDLGLCCVEILLSNWLEISEVNAKNVESFYVQYAPKSKLRVSNFRREISVEIREIDLQRQHVLCQLHEEPYSMVEVDMSIVDRNEDYRSLLEILDGLDILPLHANLLDVEIYENGMYAPRSIVLEPNLLYTVTSIADCFGAFSSHEVGFLLKKFTPMPSSRALIIGNLVNYFLDQLVFTPDLKFEDLIKTLFQRDSLGIAKLKDAEVVEMISLLKNQFQNISHVVQNQFEKIGIAEDTCLVEPTFYSAKYGIQGRLDLFAESDSGLLIIELKSGSPFRANAYGLSNTHYHQTLLYDLLIESVYGPNSKRNNFILYSKEKDKPLRFAPSLKVQQREAVKVRNRLYLHDRTLQKSKDITRTIREYTDQHIDHIKGYLKKDLNAFYDAFEELDQVENKYSHALIRFVLNEWFVSRIGHYNRENSSGLSGLWSQSLEEKKDQFNILNQLTLSVNQSDNQDPILVFLRSYKTAEISNFRIGDLGVLYPHKDAMDAILQHQIFKVTILSVEEETVTVRLRSRQDNPLLFKRHTYWNIEHDHLDNGYTNMTRAVYEWAKAPKSYKELIMGRRRPLQYEPAEVKCSHHLSNEQAQFFGEIVQSPEYYLLWGPPGTGKTSVMLREITQHYLHHREERILIMAYTNRAVDEICHAILSIKPQPDFIRIGSRYSTGESFEPFLLQSQIEKLSSRKALRNKLENQQLYVGTVASILGKQDLFNLVSFDLAIIDEASQILDHSLIGILSRVKKFVLIGDHQQLPAVVQQKKTISRVEDEELQDLGISNLRNSLFERLYNRVQAQKWTHAYGKLTFQGRMHEELMSFPSKHFYQGELQVLPKLSQLLIKRDVPNELLHLEDRLALFRRVYIPTGTDAANENIKVNQYEAASCAVVIKALITKITLWEKSVTQQTIGVIAPYRAQIALIKKHIEEQNIPHRDMITIDTVERYQGGARDIIIMSTCMNYAFQLESLVSLSSSGVDRKLNVALTRARRQFILIGNPNVLKQSPMYEKWIEEAEEIKL